MSEIKQFYYKKNRLHQLRGFYYTAQFGSITKASKELNLGQSTITLQVQSLERDLNTKLFDRTPSGLKLTNDGLVLYDMSSQSLQAFDSLCENFLNKKKEEKPLKLNIAVHHIAISHLLPKYVKKFSTLHPEVTLVIKNIKLDMALEQLRKDEIDVAIYPNIKVGNEFLHQKICSYDPMLIMARGHPLSKLKHIKLTDIAKHNIIRIDKNLIALPLFESIFQEFNFYTNIEFENANWEIVKNYVRKGIGIGFVSEICIDERDKSIKSYNLRDFFPAMDYEIITKNGRMLDSVIVDFVNILNSTYNLKNDELS